MLFRAPIDDPSRQSFVLGSRGGVTCSAEAVGRGAGCGLGVLEDDITLLGMQAILREGVQRRIETRGDHPVAAPQHQ